MIRKRTILGYLSLLSLLGSASAQTSRLQPTQNFSPLSAPQGSSVIYTLNIQGTGTPAISNLAANVNIQGAASLSSVLSNTCGGTTALNGTTLSLSGGTLAAGGSCQIRVSFIASNTIGTYTTSIPVGTITGGGFTNTEAAADSFTVVSSGGGTGGGNGAAVIGKSYSPSNADTTASTTFDLMLSFSNTTALTQRFILTDPTIFPASATGVTYTSTCPMLVNVTQTNTTFNGTVVLTPGGYCTVTIRGTVPAGGWPASSGTYTNTASANVQASDGSTSSQSATATITLTNGPVVPSTTYTAYKYGRYDTISGSSVYPSQVPGVDPKRYRDHQTYWEYYLGSSAGGIGNTVRFTDTLPASNPDTFGAVTTSGCGSNPTGTVSPDGKTFTFNTSSTNNSGCHIRVQIVSSGVTTTPRYNDPPIYTVGGLQTFQMTSINGTPQAQNTYTLYSPISVRVVDTTFSPVPTVGGVPTVSAGTPVWVAEETASYSQHSWSNFTTSFALNNSNLTPDPSRTPYVDCGLNGTTTSRQGLTSGSTSATVNLGPSADSASTPLSFPTAQPFVCTAYYPYVATTPGTVSLTNISPLSAEQQQVFQLLSSTLNITATPTSGTGTRSVVKALTPQQISNGTPIDMTVQVQDPSNPSVTRLYGTVTDHLPYGMYAVMPGPANQVDGSYNAGGLYISADLKTIRWDLHVLDSRQPLRAKVIAALPGDLINTINVADVVLDDGTNVGAPANASVKTTAYVDVLKTFNRSAMQLGETLDMNLTVINGYGVPNTLQLADVLPAGLTVYSPLSVVTTCPGMTTSTSGQQVNFNGIQLEAASTCRISIRLKATSTGTLTNTIPPGGLTSLYGSNALSRSATVTVTASGTPATLNVQKTQALCDVVGGTLQNCGAPTTAPLSVPAGSCRGVRYTLTSSNVNGTTTNSPYRPTIRDTISSAQRILSLTGTSSSGASVLFSTGNGFQAGPSLPGSGGTVQAAPDWNRNFSIDQADQYPTGASFTVVIDTAWVGCP